MTPRASWHRAAEIAVFLAYVAALAAGMSVHVMWQDEWSAWLIVRDSDSLAALFHNLRHEGHPALYYLLLYALKPLLSGAPALHAVQAVFACASVAMLLWASPFTLAERVLLPFGTYTLFEYGIKSRSYVLGLLLVWLLCALWRRKRPAPVALGLTLALLANVHILFTILACAAFAAMAGRELFGPPAAARPPAWRYLLGALLFGAGVLAAVATAMPPADAALAGAQLPFTLLRIVSGPLLAVGAFAGALQPLFALPGLLILVSAIVSLRADRQALAFFVLSTGGLLLFFDTFYEPSLQHGGVLFAGLIGAAWLARTHAANWSSTALLGPRLLIVALVAQAGVGQFLFRREFSQPYSNSRAVAAYIRTAGWAGQEIAVLADERAASVLGYLDLPSFFYVRGHRRGSFVIWDRARMPPRDVLEPGDLPDTCPLTLIAGEPLPAENAREFGLVEVRRFVGAATIENYVLYRRDCP